MKGVEVVNKRHDVAMRLLQALKEEAEAERDPLTQKPVLYTDALARARLIEVMDIFRSPRRPRRLTP